MDEKKLIHRYEKKLVWTEDDGCEEFCVGCGQCKCEPILNAIKMYEQTVRHIGHFCTKCAHKFINKPEQRDHVKWIEASEDKTEYDVLSYIDLSSKHQEEEEFVYEYKDLPKFNRCDNCRTKFSKESESSTSSNPSYHVLHTYSERYVCTTCDHDYKTKIRKGIVDDDNLKYVRCGEHEDQAHIFECQECNKVTILEYSGEIQCEDISKIKIFEYEHRVVLEDGTVTVEQMQQRIE